MASRLLALHPQGPVEHVWVAEVSLGRTKSPAKLVKGVARAWHTYKPRLPLTVRGLRIELREGAEPPAWAAKLARDGQAAPGSSSSSSAARRQSRSGGGGNTGSRPARPSLQQAAAGPASELEEKGRSMSKGLLLALAARLAFLALPMLPIRGKRIAVLHKVRQPWPVPCPC